jgi:hypothetical protein
MWPELNYKPKFWLKKLGQVWQVYKDGRSIFHGTKKKCEVFIISQ